MAVALARLAPFNDGGKESRAVFGVWFLAATVFSATGVLPAGRMLLGMQRFGTALIWSAIYPAALIGLVWVVRELMMRYLLNGGPPVFACAMLSSLMLGYGGTLIVAGSVARAMGYRLARGHRAR